MDVLTESEIADKFFDKHLMGLKSKFNNDEPWYADFVNYIVGKVVPSNWTFEKRKRFFSQVKTYFWEEPYAFKLCADNIMRRFVTGIKTLEILAHCHSGPTSGLSPEPTDNDDDKVDIEHSSADLSVKPLPDVINTNVGVYAHGSNKLLETSINTDSRLRGDKDFKMGNRISLTETGLVSKVNEQRLKKYLQRIDNQRQREQKQAKTDKKQKSQDKDESGSQLLKQINAHNDDKSQC
ncbi:hypothetical protein Tco_0675706 [Tanacetum coccineum]